MTPPSATPTLRDRIRALYEDDSRQAMRVRWATLALDGALILYFLATTFVEHGRWMVLADYGIGAVLAAEWLLRLWIARDRLGFLTQPLVVLDLAVILSLFAPTVTENFIFLRILRALRLMRSYHVLKRLRTQVRFFAQHEAVIFSAANLLVFIFVISAAVYALQVRVNHQIANYVDALYFTITTLTTTGFGDIVMIGEWGRVVAIVIMIVGVSLFLRLIQSIFRPRRIEYECPDCGLDRHDPDAVHCKHCGRLLHIRTHGEPN
ncbi:ion channel [Fontimonas sp. SYSU GA230001]|uniref:potassium channel family protein n=1 Tax=Fontimonas sp. SYSU GA230001 TaxID=3142450 RepID=UPI0032B6015D